MSTETVIKIKASEKDSTKNPRQLRASGFLPITIYGNSKESTIAQIDTHEFAVSYKKDAIFEIELGSKKIKTKIQNLQKKYATNQILNIEFKTV